MSAEIRPKGEKPELDLAFELAEGLDPELKSAAGALASPQTAEEGWTRLVGSWLAELANDIPAPLRHPAYSLGLLITDDRSIAELNGEWRQQEGPTDVLAFAAQEAPLPSGALAELGEAEPLELGDIVVSLETAARQAQEHGHDLEWELRFLASHGLLHLLGWDHPDAASLERMLARQELLLVKAGVPISKQG